MKHDLLIDYKYTSHLIWCIYFVLHLHNTGDGGKNRNADSEAVV